MATPVTTVVDGQKTCSACGICRSLGEFSLHPTGLGGRRSHCKRCMAARTKVWRKKNPAVALKHKRVYWTRHAERLNKRRRANRDEQVRERERKWRQAHPEQNRAQNARRRAALANQSPEVTAWIAELLGMPCTYCDATNDIEVDHIVPLSRGGAHVVENLAPACRRCNRSRKNLLVLEWLEGVV